MLCNIKLLSLGGRPIMQVSTHKAGRCDVRAEVGRHRKRQSMIDF